MNDTGTISIRREPGSFRNGSTRYDVLVDGKKFGDMTFGQEQSIELGAGHHKVQIKCGWWRSELMEIEVFPNSSAWLEWAHKPPSKTIYKKRWGRLAIFVIVLAAIFFYPHFARLFSAAAACLYFVEFILVKQSAYYLKRVDGDWSAR